MYILYLILALVVLLLMVTIHEFGHYIAGKLLGFKINEFSIGFGKALYSKKKKNGELFSIRLVPLGGYCAFEGEEEDSDNEQAFMKQKPWKRLIVLFSGAFFNFLSAIIFTVILLCGFGYDIPKINAVTDVASIEYSASNIGEFKALNGSEKIYKINGNFIDSNNHNTYILSATLGSYFSANSTTYSDANLNVELSYILKDDSVDNIDSATFNTLFVDVDYLNNKFVDSENGLKENDIIYEINGKKISFITNDVFSTLISEYSVNDSITLTVKRNGKIVNVNCDNLDFGLPILVYENAQNEIITESEYNTLTPPEKANYPISKFVHTAKKLGVTSSAYKFSFGEALVNAVPYTFGFAYKVLEALWQLISGQLSLNAVGGPITTITTMATYTQSNFSTLFVLLPLIAANLAVFNWLPIPALDGSKMVFTLVEMIRKKPINQKVENRIHTIGLIVLFAFVIIADVYHLIF